MLGCGKPVVLLSGIGHGTLQAAQQARRRAPATQPASEGIMRGIDDGVERLSCEDGPEQGTGGIEDVLEHVPCEMNI